MSKPSIEFDVVKMPNTLDRFIIVRKDSGEVLDDAQGYGYKNAKNTYKAGWYKFGGGKRKHDESKAWWKKNGTDELLNGLTDIGFYGAKCGMKRKEIEKDLLDVVHSWCEKNGIHDFRDEYIKSYYRL